MKKQLLFFVIFFSCNHIQSIDRAIENAIENSDTKEMLRLVSGNFTVSQEEKAYYLKLAKSKSERAMSRVHKALPKFSKAFLGMLPLILGIGNFIYCGKESINIWQYPKSSFGQYDVADPDAKLAGELQAKSNKMARITHYTGCIVSLLLISFSIKEIYKGIIENNEVIARDNALAVETIVARIRAA